ncbi:MAG: UvrD-helicase domain-containing protein, partial [Demequina sp.]|uniref:UvrD-helicase domain-containing protein n=1 Tax=Demequina sp. TaxID=2050685 RepID=UPI003A8AF448
MVHATTRVREDGAVGRVVKTGWSVEQHPEGVTVAFDGRALHLAGADASRLRTSRRFLRRCLIVDGPIPLRLMGLRRADAPVIRAAVALSVARANLEGPFEAAARGRDALNHLISTRTREQRWIAYDDVAQCLTDVPADSTALLAAVAEPDRAAAVAALSDVERDLVAFIDADHLARVAEVNRAILREEMATRASLLNTIETSPLSAEQARAVLTYDSRVRVIAAAGSGKTSVMVARAAYAVERGFADASRIVMLAFNADAAAELGDRTRARFAAAGIDATGLKASTFHAFGLDILEKARGSRPALAPWVANGTELEHVEGILADLVASGDLSPDDRLEAGDRLAALLLDLMGHVKAAGLTKAELRRTLSGRRDEEATRARRVLDLYWRVHERWDSDLAAAGAVDYPAMLSDAARALEKKPRLVDADLVLVDEFQDTSPARARLVRALTRAAHTSLLVVGDDWQA